MAKSSWRGDRHGNHVSAAPKASDHSRSFQFQEQLVNVAPTPVLSRFKRGYDRMLGRAEVFRGVPVLGIVAAAHVPTRAAEAKMNPCISHCQTLFATVGVRPGRSDGAQMPATRRHGEIASRGSRPGRRIGRIQWPRPREVVRRSWSSSGVRHPHREPGIADHS